MMDPAMMADDPLQAPMNSRQRIAMALQMQKGMQPQGTGILGGLNTALNNGLQMYGMRKMMQPAPRPTLPQRDPVMGTGYASPDPIMGQGTGMVTDPSAYDYLKPQGY